MTDNPYSRLPHGLIISTNETPMPIYSNVLADESSQHDHMAVGGECEQNVDISIEIDDDVLQLNFNDPRVVESFVGHIQEPQISLWLREAVSVCWSNIWAFALWEFVYLFFTGYFIGLGNVNVHGGLYTIMSAFSLPITLCGLTWKGLGFIYALHILKTPVGSDASSQIKTLLSTFSALISNFQFFFRYIVLCIIFSLSVALGLFCFIIPGIWLAVSFSLSFVIYLEHGSDMANSVTDSLRISKNIVGQKWWCWFLFSIVYWLLNVFILSTPISLVYSAIALREVMGLKKH